MAGATHARPASYRTIVVPLLEHDETRHAVELACRLAAGRRSRVVVVAPLVVDIELPLEAHTFQEESALEAELRRECAIAESYGVSARSLVVRVRAGQLGSVVAREASGLHADLIVVGASTNGRGGSRHRLSPDVRAILQEAPCRVMLAALAS